jgi:hypothetical protein
VVSHGGKSVLRWKLHLCHIKGHQGDAGGRKQPRPNIYVIDIEISGWNIMNELVVFRVGAN